MTQQAKTVGDLIEKLKKYDRDQQVRVYGHGMQHKLDVKEENGVVLL